MTYTYDNDRGRTRSGYNSQNTPRSRETGRAGKSDAISLHDLSYTNIRCRRFAKSPQNADGRAKSRSTDPVFVDHRGGPHKQREEMWNYWRGRVPKRAVFFFVPLALDRYTTNPGARRHAMTAQPYRVLSANGDPGRYPEVTKSKGRIRVLLQLRSRVIEMFETT